MKRLQITLNDDLCNWLTKQIKEMKYGSYSHAINCANNPRCSFNKQGFQKETHQPETAQNKFVKFK